MHTVNLDDSHYRGSYNLRKRDDGETSVTSGMRTGGTRRPSTYVKASNCVSYYLDADGNKVNARIFRETHDRRSTARRAATTRIATDVERFASILPNIGRDTIGD